MANKPFNNKTFLGIRRATNRDYPPKDKKIFWAGSFVGGEHFHKSNFGPLKDGFNLGNNPCAGRVLRPLSQVTWDCGGDFPKTFQASVSGAVGAVTYEMDPFWSDVNQEGDKATIDGDGIITIGTKETEVCQGAYPPWIIYWACDECGCSSGTIWLADCTGDCCVVPCDPLPTVTGANSIAISSSAQYTFNDAQGNVSWVLDLTDGGGASIDSNGLVTTGADACGTGIVKGTDSCCGEFTKKVLLDYPAGVNSEWSNISFESGSYVQDCGGDCNNGGNSNQDVVNDGLRYRGTSRQFWHGSGGGCNTCDGCGFVFTGPELPAGWGCGSPHPDFCWCYVNQLWIDEWTCSP